MAADTSIARLLRERAGLIEAWLDGCLPRADAPPVEIHEAMRYAVLGGGKRLRPLLAVAMADLAGHPPEAAREAACAIELVHAASLVFDDLPCMDNAALRRGQPAVHVRFGEAAAVLAGLGLLTRAFDMLAQAPSPPGGEAGRTEAIAELAQAIGSQGVVGGQFTDLQLKHASATPGQLESVFEQKAAALFLAAVRVPGKLLGMKSGPLYAVSEYGRALGMAFQITDDLLDAPDDAAGSMPTHETQLGPAGARRRLDEWIEKAAVSLEPFGQRAALLRAMAEYVRTRTT